MRRIARGRCSYKNCKNTVKNCNLKFFYFPMKDSERRNKWIRNCENDDLNLLEDRQIGYLRVCQLHFTESSFSNTLYTRISKFAVPTLDGMVNEPLEIDTPQKHQCSEDFVTEIVVCTTSAEETKNVTMELVEPTTSTEESDVDFTPGDTKRLQQHLRANLKTLIDLTYTATSQADLERGVRESIVMIDYLMKATSKSHKGLALLPIEDLILLHLIQDKVEEGPPNGALMDYNFPGSGNPPMPSLNPPPPPPPPPGPMTSMPMGMSAMMQQGHMMQQGPMMGGMMQPHGFMPMNNMMNGQTMHQMMTGLNNPSMNDAPLEFDMNKNKPPMPIPGGGEERIARNEKGNEENKNEVEPRRERRGGRDRRDRDRERRENRREEREGGGSVNNGSGSQLQQVQQANTNQNSNSPTGNSAGTQALGAANNMWGGMMGPMGYPMMGMNMMGSGMMGDPNMMGMGQYGMMPGMMPDGSMAPMIGPDGSVMSGNPEAGIQQMMPNLSGMMVKEIIHCKSCTLFPPNPNAPPPTTRERPPGCRTIFVGGLPENTTEEIIDEIFSRCGEMSTCRLSKKNFCHIRFVFEASVDAAVFLSGYRVRIGSNGDTPNTGRLHVDYAQARDDLYEWECRERAMQREMRHRERVEKERLRPPSPPPVVHYTEHEAVNVSEKIKVADESFAQAVQVVITWLERGDCLKRNANTFYTMIQSTNSHVRRLLNEKAQYEEELQRARDIFKGRMQGILIQFGQIERVFTAASHKKVWDHFTKAQRKNIEMWKKQTAEIKTVQLEEVLNERADEEMEVSDTEEDYLGSGKKKPRLESDDKLASIKEENDSLRCQLEAYKNEVDLVRGDSTAELDQKDKQIKMLQQTLQGMQQQLIMEAKRRQADDDIRVKALEAKLKTATEAHAQMQVAAVKAAIAEAASKADAAKKSASKIDTDATGEEGEPKEGETADEECSVVAEELSIDVADLLRPVAVSNINDKEAKLIGLISTFLHVHPFGASVDYVWSYLQKMEPLLRPSDVEALMSRFPLVFRETLSGIGANMERRWQFSGFDV